MVQRPLLETDSHSANQDFFNGNQKFIISIGERGMGVRYKGSQGQTKRNVELQEEEEEKFIIVFTTLQKKIMLLEHVLVP
jgi:hypothetical protein